MKEKTKLKKVVIDRHRWLTPQRVNGAYDGGLLYDSKSRKMCCLGFAMRQVGGCSIAQIKDHGMPSDLLEKEPIPGFIVESGFGYLKNSDFAGRAADINDDKTISDKQREKSLVALAKKHGFKFVFVN